ncbi:unannotated protein [freshwater metagenome]|uniref:Unannotated protein n=1 Tax=freshwater metagenome TaxID=449393 RepID=A0A6J7QR96_9ZZZZ
MLAALKPSPAETATGSTAFPFDATDRKADRKADRAADRSV